MAGIAKRAFQTVIQWVDADIKASTLPSQAPSMYVAVVPFLLGCIGFSFADPWRMLSLCLGCFLALTWLALWGSRLFRYIRSVDYYQSIKLVQSTSAFRGLINKTGNYQDRKLNEIRNILITGIIFIAIFSIYNALVPSRIYVNPVSGIAMGCGIFSLIAFAYGGWQLLSSPEQDDRFLNWMTPGLSRSAPEDIGTRLPDPSDPDFTLPTFRYLIRRLRSRQAR